MVTDFEFDVKGKTISYSGNSNLKPCKCVLEYTKEHVEEIIRCKNNWKYFAQTYYHITSLDEGIIKVKTRFYQDNIINNFINNRFNIVLASRQCGKSTSYEIFCLWYILFNEAKTVAILANKLDTSVGILAKIKMAYELLPKFLQQGIKKWNERSIELENGCKILASATSSSAIRSKSVNVLILDEMGFVFPKQWSKFYSSVYPTISSSLESKIIIVSCVVKDTFVFGEHGIQEISAYIDTAKEGAYHTQSYKVLGKEKYNNGNIMVNNGIAPTRILSTPFGELECSLEHKLWACKEGMYNWYKSKDLSVGDFVSLKYGMNVWNNDDDISDIKIPIVAKSGYNYSFGDIISSDLAYFLGLFIAEGYARKILNTDGTLKGGQIVISCGDDITWVFDKLKLIYSTTDNVHYIINSKYLIQFIDQLGFNIDLIAPQKCIPQRLMQMSKKNIASMLCGIFDGDGSSRSNRGNVSINLSSKKLLMQIKMLLLNFGIMGDYYTGITPPTDKSKVESVYYRTELPRQDSLKFYDEIGFGLIRKQNNKEMLLLTDNPKYSHDIIPFSKKITKEFNMSSLSVKVRHSGKKLCNHYSRTQMLRWKIIAESVNFWDNSDIKNFFTDNIKEDIKWLKIKSIKDSENEVFDFSLNHTENDKWCHSVLYNGLVGHQTPNGLNQFYKFWTDAINGKDDVAGKGNMFVPYRVDWWEVPGRDQKWKEETIANTSEREFASEFGNDFLGSSRTLIESHILSTITQFPPIYPMGLKIDSIYLPFIKVYDNPVPGHIYSLGLDSSEMMEETVGDAIALQVLDITTTPYIQVATCHIKEGITYFEIPEIAVQLGKYYNNAYMFIEANSTGLEIANLIVDDFEYENVYYGQKSNLPGIKTTAKTKRLGCSNLKMLIEGQHLILKDSDTITQLTTFTKKKKSYGGDSGYLDDAVMALIVSLYFVNDKQSVDGIVPADFVIKTFQENKDNDGTSVIINPDSCGDAVLDEMERVKESMKDFQWMFAK